MSGAASLPERGQQFGHFEILTAERRLRVDGQSVALGSRAFDLLAALVARRDRVVPKEELITVVWPGLVVEDNNLQVQISALRKVLGTEAIATVPGRGYQFTVAAASPGAAAQPAAGLPLSRVPERVAGVSTRVARLLVVDDNKVNRLLLCRSLELLGHEVASADNGRSALDKLRSERFDLLLLDLEMPELDGFDLLEQRAVDPVLQELPVIVTSSLEGVAQIARCIELGADDYLHKPVNPVLLRARVDSSLERKRWRDRQNEQIRRFATGAVAQDLAEGGFSLGGRRVQATVMFSDIRGFTSLVESQPPEETIELLNAYYTLMFDAISSQGGVVNQMTGDGLMAVFGAPLALPEPALSAARAALDMQEMVTLFNAERASEGKVPIAIGIGIASGQVIAGYTGTQQRATYTCVGDTVNLAARLEAHTKVAGHGVLMDENSRTALTGRLPTLSLGEVQFKGKAVAVPVFALQGMH